VTGRFNMSKYLPRKAIVPFYERGMHI